MLAIKAMNEVELESVVVVVGSEALRLMSRQVRVQLQTEVARRSQSLLRLPRAVSQQQEQRLMRQE